MNTSKLIRTKLVEYIKTIKVANGFELDVVDANVYERFNKNLVAQKTDKDYPKVFICLDDGSFNRRPSDQSEDSYNYLVVFICKSNTTGTKDDPSDTAEKFIFALRKLLNSNDTLGGSVQDITCDGFTTDSGFTHPEGVAVCRVSATALGFI